MVVCDSKEDEDTTVSESIGGVMGQGNSTTHGSSGDAGTNRNAEDCVDGADTDVSEGGGEFSSGMALTVDGDQGSK